MTERYLITLEALGGLEEPWTGLPHEIRLRRLLKTALRRDGLRAVKVQRASVADPEAFAGWLLRENPCRVAHVCSANTPDACLALLAERVDEDIVLRMVLPKGAVPSFQEIT